MERGAGSASNDEAWVVTKSIIGRGFPGGAVVESPPADAGDMGLCPGPRGSHMLQSSLAREPWLLSPHVRSLCSATGEAATVRGLRTAKKKKIYKIHIFEKNVY